ncbi:MAG TPA: hypothetical protein VHY19_09855 [Steroidobacteraceae bacterium]|nr:hypothetical protein [Steroidobacteraceae bacterium]
MNALAYKNTRVVRSGWLEEGGRRLDCNPYMSGALEARDTLRALKARKDPLKALTAGYAGGIYNGPMFRRNYVDSPEQGVPFISSGTMLLADLSGLPLLRRKDAESCRLSYLRLTSGMTLISCSGTIGRMCYVRPDMDGVWSSQDVMKVVPDSGRIPPGYLHAFLSSRYGVPLVVSGTYGAIIQHIEPEHIADLPVPRFSGSFENDIHLNMENAAHRLSTYQMLLNEATARVFRISGVPNPWPMEWHEDNSDVGFSVMSSELEPLRAWNHSKKVRHIVNAIESGEFSKLADVVDLEWLRWRVMFKRIDADEQNGIEVLSQRPLFQLFPEGRWISRRYLLRHSPRYVVPDRTIIVAKQGTLGADELFCRAEFITGEIPLKRAYTDHCMRIVARKEAIQPGYLFAFLRSNAGFRILRGLAEGSKQQDLHWRTVPKISVPRLTLQEESDIAEMVYEAYSNRNMAVDVMLSAKRRVEMRIQSGV